MDGEELALEGCDGDGGEAVGGGVGEGGGETGVGAEEAGAGLGVDFVGLVEFVC